MRKETGLVWGIVMWVWAACFGLFVAIQSVRIPDLFTEFPLLTVLSVSLLPIGVYNALRLNARFNAQS